MLKILFCKHVINFYLCVADKRLVLDERRQSTIKRPCAVGILNDPMNRELCRRGWRRNRGYCNAEWSRLSDLLRRSWCARYQAAVCRRRDLDRSRLSSLLFYWRDNFCGWLCGCLGN